MDEKILFLELPTSVGSEFIKPEDIISVRANDKNICLSIENQADKPIRLSISRAEKFLSQTYFVRCHRSHIINVLKIKQRLKKQSKILLCNGQEVPVSRRYKKQLDTILYKFCKNITKEQSDIQCIR